jgi:hypothetical protein
LGSSSVPLSLSLSLPHFPYSSSIPLPPLHSTPLYFTPLLSLSLHSSLFHSTPLPFTYKEVMQTSLPFTYQEVMQTALPFTYQEVMQTSQSYSLPANPPPAEGTLRETPGSNTGRDPMRPHHCIYVEERGREKRGMGGEGSGG